MYSRISAGCLKVLNQAQQPAWPGLSILDVLVSDNYIRDTLRVYNNIESLVSERHG